MKISKSILLVALALGATGLLQAQDVTTKNPEKTKSNIAPGSSSPATDQKSEPKAVSKLTKSDAVVTTTPSPLTRDENKTAPGNEKPTFKTIDSKEVTNPLSAENKKTADGTAGKPQHLAVAPVSKNDQEAKPLTLAKPATVVTDPPKQ